MENGTHDLWFGSVFRESLRIVKNLVVGYDLSQRRMEGSIAPERDESSPTPFIRNQHALHGSMCRCSPSPSPSQAPGNDPELPEGPRDVFTALHSG